MKKSLLYILYYTICIVLLIISLIFFWWFTGKPYTRESFVTPAPYMVLVGLTAGGDVYYADVDVPMTPKWIKNTGLTGVGDIAGSYGTLYTTGTTTAAAGPIKYGPYDSVTQTTVSGTATQIAADDAKGFAVVSANSMLYSSTDTGTLSTVSANVPTMSISNGKVYLVDTGNSLYYSDSVTNFLGVKTSPGTTSWRQVSFDNQVCAIDSAGFVWCADKNIATATANWTQQGTQKFSRISLKGGRMVGVGTDGKTYYADSYTTDQTSPVRWQALPTQPYTTAGATTGTPVTFTKVILMFPSPSARRRRFKSAAGSGAACNSNEEAIGSYCYQPCPSGRPATGTTCPYRVKYIAATPRCAGETAVKSAEPRGGVEFINDSCYQQCPGGYRASGDTCEGTTTPKAVSSLKGSTTTPRYTPPNDNCPVDGSVAGRYVRIRPTSLIDNNKLCIQRLIVKDSAGIVLSSTQQGVPTVDGTISGIHVNGIFPIAAVNVTNTTDPNIIRENKHLVFLIADDGYTKMVANDAARTAKYYAGPISNYKPENWPTYTINATAGSYVATIRSIGPTPPVSTGFSSDETSTGLNAPLTGGTGNYYLSGHKWDKDPDGGSKNRASNLYWEVDLGAVKNIKTIEFTGCNYVPQSGEVTAGSGKSIPNGDQTTGMKIEVLHKSNEAGTAALASRTLGPSKGVAQIITFNYVEGDAIVKNRCYDKCPPINGKPTINTGERTCLAASGGITNRSVTVPQELSDPVCGPPTNAAGETIPIPATSRSGSRRSVSIKNWVPDPDNPGFLLSCDNLPGSTLVPISRDIDYSGTSMSEVRYKNLLVNDTITPSCSQQYSIDNGNAGGTLQRCANETPVAGMSRRVSRLDGLNYRAVSGSSISGSSPIRTSIKQLWKDKDGKIITSSESNYICVDLTKKSSFCPYTASDAQKLMDITQANISEHISFTANNLCELTNSSYSKTFQIFLKGDIYCKWKYGISGYEWGDQCYVSGLLKGGISDNVDITLPILDSIRRGKRQPDVADHPILPDGAYAFPQRMQGTCKCLNANGSVNTSAFIYNGKCMKCSSSNDVFYAKGQVTKYTWGSDTTGCVEDSGGTTGLSSTRFGSLQDAKDYCESQGDYCKGIFRRSSEGEKSTYSATSLECNTQNQNNVSWTKSSTTTGSVTENKITMGDRKGDTFSDQPIPRAFADDYKHSSRPDKPTNIVTTQGAMDLYQTTTNMGSSAGSSIVDFIRSTLGIASADSLFKQSVERPDTYYSLIGTQRVIKANIDSTTDNNGICVGPCDPLHPLHDPVQLYHSAAATPPLYVLYGTTCHDATEITFNQPSIPAIYTPEIGEECPAINNKIYEKINGQCLEQCSSSEIDNGTSCTTPSVPRPFTQPCYSCPDGSSNCGGSKQGSSKLPTIVDNVCVYPCDPGFTLRGDFCEPTPTIQPVPTAGSGAIKCTSTAYLSKKKWLCETYDDLNALLTGYSAGGNTAGTTYVDPDDTVCVTDDSSTAMYYCQSVYDAVNQTPDTIRDDFTATCDRLVKAYYDLSNNLNILSDVNTTAVVAARQVSKMYDTLNSVYKSMCGSGSGSSSSTCTSMNSQLNSLRTNMNLGSSISGSISNPINTAARSRDQLLAEMNKFKCSRFNPNTPSG